MAIIRRDNARVSRCQPVSAGVSWCQPVSAVQSWPGRPWYGELSRAAERRARRASRLLCGPALKGRLFFSSVAVLSICLLKMNPLGCFITTFGLKGVHLDAAAGCCPAERSSVGGEKGFGGRGCLLCPFYYSIHVISIIGELLPAPLSSAAGRLVQRTSCHRWY